MEDPSRNSIFTSGLWALAAAVVMVGWVAWRNVDEDREASKAPFQAILDARSDDERALVASLMTEAFGLVRSPEVRDALRSLSASYPDIYARADTQSVSADDVARIVALEQPGARYAPVAVQIVGGDDPRDPMREHASAGEGQGYGRYADMAIGRAMLDQYRSADVVERSCAVNAAAHEYAHTIATTPVGFRIAFTDTTGDQQRIPDREHPGAAVASYLVGAVSQCVWLERQGRIDRAGVPNCVQVFGVNAFNWKRCRQFSAGQPVAPRSDLAPPAPPL